MDAEQKEQVRERISVIRPIVEKCVDDICAVLRHTANEDELAYRLAMIETWNTLTAFLLQADPRCAEMMIKQIIGELTGEEEQDTEDTE